MALIGTVPGASRGVIINGQFSEDSAAHGQSYYGISDNNTWAVDYGSDKGILIGAGRCSNVSGTGSFMNGPADGDITTHTTSELGAYGGNYCYCRITGYKDGNGDLQTVSSPWLFFEDQTGPGCSGSCAGSCSNRLMYNGNYFLPLRIALFGISQ